MQHDNTNNDQTYIREKLFSNAVSLPIFLPCIYLAMGNTYFWGEWNSDYLTTSHTPMRIQLLQGWKVYKIQPGLTNNDKMFLREKLVSNVSEYSFLIFLPCTYLAKQNKLITKMGWRMYMASLQRKPIVECGFQITMTAFLVFTRFWSQQKWGNGKGMWKKLLSAVRLSQGNDILNKSSAP